MSKKQSAFLSEVVAHVQSAAGYWFERLPDEAKEELRAARAEYQAGKIIGKPHCVAAGLINAADKRGWRLPQEKAIAAWLKRND